MNQEIGFTENITYINFSQQVLIRNFPDAWEIDGIFTYSNTQQFTRNMKPNVGRYTLFFFQLKFGDRTSIFWFVDTLFESGRNFERREETSGAMFIPLKWGKRIGLAVCMVLSWVVACVSSPVGRLRGLVVQDFFGILPWKSQDGPKLYSYKWSYTPLKIDMEHYHGGSEDHFP